MILSPLALLSGFLVIATLLFLLQRLRVRHREVAIITTLFWRRAVRDARATVLVRRFRHPWAYVLVLSICGLMWLSLAGPRARHEGDRDYVLLLDGSAAMTQGDRFALAVSQVQQWVERLPREDTRVLLCASSVGTLLNPGEDGLLLERRLPEHVPEVSPSSLARALRSLSRSVEPGRATEVLVFGGAPVDPAVLALLPEEIRVRRVAEKSTVPQDGERGGNRGITALGVGEPASGVWDRVDLLVEVRGAELNTASVALTLDGEPLSTDGVRVRQSPGAVGFLFPDLPARGQLLRVRLQAGDDLEVDDEAGLWIAARPLIRVALQEGLPPLRWVLETDPAIVLDSRDPDVTVRRGTLIDDRTPALELVPRASQLSALSFEDPREAEVILSDVVPGLGLAQIDGYGLAEAMGDAITVTARTGTRRRIVMWEELLSEEFNFTKSRAFPLFVARAVRWLANDSVTLSRAVAGEALTGRRWAFADGNGRLLDPVGADFTPPTAGEYRSADGERLVVSLLDPATTTPSIGPAESMAVSMQDLATAVAAWDPAIWLVLVALGLLFVEWLLFRTGRMP